MARSVRAVPWATAAFLAVIAVLHALDPRDPWHRFVSEYGMAYPVLLGVGFAAWAVSGVALAAGLWRQATTTARAGAVCFAAFAALILVAATFQIDSPSLGPQRTLEGVIHVSSGRLAVAALTLAVLLGFVAVRGRRSAGLLLALLLVAFVVPVAVSPRAIGLTQRVLVGVEIAAVLVLARSLSADATPASGRTDLRT